MVLSVRVARTEALQDLAVLERDFDGLHRLLGSVTHPS